MDDEPIIEIRRYGDTPVVVFCDHATNAMPADLDGLRLPDDILKTHIAWDIGASRVADAMAHALGGTIATCGFSRLVVDPNRAPDSADFIPAISDGIAIPGNAGVSDEERAARKARFFDPYHEALNELLNSYNDRAAPFAVSIHSFTKRMTGAPQDRPWALGVLWRHDEETARNLISWLKTHTGWAIGDNEPYDARILNYTIDRHLAPRSWRHVTLEIRQDLISDDHGVVEVAAVLADAIAAMMERRVDRKGAA